MLRAAIPIFANAILMIAGPASAGSNMNSDIPISASDTAMAGRSLFHQICSHCHGPNMVTGSGKVFDLRKFPHDDEERFRSSVFNGKGDMPQFGEILTTEEIDVLWAYVRTGGKI